MRHLYIYRARYSAERWEAVKKRFYEESDEYLKKRGIDILNNGHLEEERDKSSKWVFVRNIRGEIIKGDIGITNTGYDGWKLNSF